MFILELAPPYKALKIHAPIHGILAYFNNYAMTQLMSKSSTDKPSILPFLHITSVGVYHKIKI